MGGGRQFKISSYKAFFAQLKSRSLNSVGFCFISNWKETEITCTSLDQPYPHTQISIEASLVLWDPNNSTILTTHTFCYRPPPQKKKKKTTKKSRPAATFNCCQTKRSCCVHIKWIIAIKKKNWITIDPHLLFVPLGELAWPFPLRISVLWELQVEHKNGLQAVNIINVKLIWYPSISNEYGKPFGKLSLRCTYE